MNDTPLSPLNEADPQSLDELFSADPLSLTQEERGEMIAAFRKARHLWQMADDEAAKTKGARTPKSKSMTKLSDVDLSQLKIKF